MLSRVGSRQGHPMWETRKFVAVQILDAQLPNPAMVRHLGLRLQYYHLRGGAHKLAVVAMVDARLLNLPAVRTHGAGVAIPE
jgi:hypothetical protein